eukprot:gene8016-8875_t
MYWDEEQRSIDNVVKQQGKMYFPVGSIKCHNAKYRGDRPLIYLRLNRAKSLMVVLSSNCIYLWKVKPRLLLTVWRRDDKDVDEFGENSSAILKPDSTELFVMTNKKSIFLFDILNQNGEFIYHLQNAKFVEQLQPNGIEKCYLMLKCKIELDDIITSYASRSEELIVATSDGWMHRIKWNGIINDGFALNIRQIRFSVDLETTTGAILGGDTLYLRGVECSPLLGGFAVILSDGRAGFLMSSSALAKPSEVIGIFAKEINDATCVSINHKYQMIVFGCKSGQAYAYVFDEMSAGLTLSHKFTLPIKDYPDQGCKAGMITSLSWTPDGCAMAMTWSNGGISVWSVFGALLLCTLNADYGSSSDCLNQESFLIKSMGWCAEGYQLLMIPDISPTSFHLKNGDILQMDFAKSALTVNPNMPNRQHLFLQGESSVYINSCDMILPNSNGTSSSHSLFSNRHWQTIQVPHTYINTNWPIRYSAVDWSGRRIAVAAKFGYAHYSLNTRKWKLFGNETQERNVTCRGGLCFWDEYLIVACYNLETEADEIRFHHVNSNVDVHLAQTISVDCPVFLMNTFHDILLIYTADCEVSFYRLVLDNKLSPASIVPTKMSQVSLLDYLQHPLTVTSVTTLNTGAEAYEANSLIVNVAGKILMLQKDRPAAERQGEKVKFLHPIVLASCVENVWYMINIGSNKRHLSESLWLACGSQGMKAWLPLFPIEKSSRQLGFLSKRIMLHFELHVYPLAVLFEDAVILGIGTDFLQNSASNGLLKNSNIFSFFHLERTTQVFLPHILRQLLRRNLGVHALEIARTCTSLPYFTHVLELMLHEVLEKEATASVPIPDPLLPRIVAFIQEFPQYHETVCHCARKTEVALWRHLFSVVGNPINLFQECCDALKLETAASYLIIIQNLEHHSVSRQYATLLLEAALDNDKWELSRDLVRFLTAIGKGDPDSPPRTPQHKTFHPSILKDEDNNEEDITPVMVPIHKPSTRTNSSSSAQFSKVLNPGSPSSIDEQTRPSNLKLNRSTSSLTDYSSISRPVTVESCEQFFTDLILARHARKLLTSFRLRDLGRFAAHLDFDLTAWFTKERFRAARIDDFLEALIVLHRQFEWSFPNISNGSRMSAASRESTAKLSRRSSQLDQRNVDVSSTTSDVDSPNIANEIQARLASIKVEEDAGSNIKDFSETSSMTQSVDYEIESVDVCSWVTEPPIMIDIEQQRTLPLGSKLCERQIRHLLNILIEARCVDWCILLSMMLDDLSGFMQLIDKMATFKDLTPVNADELIQQINILECWSEQNW